MEVVISGVQGSRKYGVMDPIGWVECHAPGTENPGSFVVKRDFDRSRIDGREAEGGVGVEAKAAEILPVVLELAVDLAVLV